MKECESNKNFIDKIDLIYGVTFAKNNKYIKMIRLQNINLTSTEAIQRLANNHAIAVNLRDAFPYPYTIEDAITVCYINFQN